MRLVALMDFAYDHKYLKIGDEFDVNNEQHRSLLIYGGRAKEKAAVAEDKRELQNRVMKAADEEETKPAQPQRVTQRGRYPRRDMRPEE